MEYNPELLRELQAARPRPDDLAIEITWAIEEILRIYGLYCEPLYHEEIEGPSIFDKQCKFLFAVSRARKRAYVLTVPYYKHPDYRYRITVHSTGFYGKRAQVRDELERLDIQTIEELKTHLKTFQLLRDHL